MRIDVKSIYSRRFNSDIEFRKKIWSLLCAEFFQKFVPVESTILEVGAGYCEFINNIHANRKIALDINPDVRKHAEPNVEVLEFESDNIQGLSDSSVDIVFVSNLFEHLTHDSIVNTIQEIKRVLRPGGKFISLHPNIRFCSRDYWMFFDHITPIDDRALLEVLEINNFHVLINIPRFLPYTTKSNMQKKISLN